MDSIKSEHTDNEKNDSIFAYIDQIKEEIDFKIEVINKKLQQLRSVVSKLKGGSE